jgi:hypothetical protein
LLKIMADHFDPSLSEDQLIAFLCGEFGGLSASILQYAMGTTPPLDSRSGSDMCTSTESEVSDRMVDGGGKNYGDEIGFDKGVQTNGKNMAASGARYVQAPAKSDNMDVFASNVASLYRSAWAGNASEKALIAIIDSLVIASELELINSEGEYEARTMKTSLFRIT